ncbi:MAG: hypothetical protein D6706_05270, partial [Chloroflexi bacterium]
NRVGGGQVVTEIGVHAGIDVEHPPELHLISGTDTIHQTDGVILLVEGRFMLGLHLRSEGKEEKGGQQYVKNSFHFLQAFKRGFLYFPNNPFLEGYLA